MELRKFIETLLLPSNNLFEATVDYIESSLEKPNLEKNKFGLFWKYKEPKLEHVCVLRAVRIVSAFYAIRHLIENGFVQEIAVLLRTINEFQQDIFFLLDGYGEREPDEMQLKFINECTKDHFVNKEIPFEGATPYDAVQRKKINARLGKIFGQFANPTDATQLEKIEADSYSRYVHGSFSSILEIYGGELFKSKYHMNGLLNTPRIDSWNKQIYIFIHRNFNVFNTMSIKFKLLKCAETLLAKRKEIEFYAEEFGLTFNSMIMSKALNKIKSGKPLI